MEWRLFATLSEAAGTGEVSLEYEEATVREAFDALCESHPELTDEVLDEDGDVYDHVRLLVDGTDPFTGADGWETTVDSGTELALFPPVSGG